MPSLRDSIKTALRYELGQTSPKGTVASLTGAWGSGKTHLWREVETELKGAGKNVGYVSLFGLAGLSEARSAVLSALVFEPLVHADEGKSRKALAVAGSWLFDKLPDVVNKVAKAKIGVDLITRNLDLTRLVPEHSIICFDDLERISSTFPLEDALG